MGIFDWCTRRCGGLALIATALLCYHVVSKQARLHDSGIKSSSQGLSSDPSLGSDIWTLTFAYYALAVHVLIATFYLRLVWSTVELTTRLKGAQTEFCQDANSDGSHVTANENRDGLGSVIHAIVIPNYKEEIDVLRETLDVLASHPGARSSYDIYLAMEQREEKGEAKALTLINEFSTAFHSVHYTAHPSDVPGESAGKGSNLAWAARQLSARYIDSARTDVIITGIDADSHLSRQYFAQLSKLHLSNPDTASTTLYSAPIIFDRNPHEVTAVTRVSDILWAGTGLSGLYSGSTISPPTSAYSLPLVLADRVRGWDPDCEAIGEDIHMFIKCFFALNGHLHVQTILSPISQTNVNGNGEILDGIRARYKQGLRHMWGALDCGFYIRNTVQLWLRRRNRVRAFRPLHTAKDFPEEPSIDEMQSIDQQLETGMLRDYTVETLAAPDWWRVLRLGHRMLELHFMPVQVIAAISLNLFIWVSNGIIPHDLIWVIRLCSILGLISGLQLPIYLFIYERYHKVAVESREKEMTEAGLANRMHFAHRNWKNMVDYFVGPIVVLLSGIIPALHAQISHFWTLDLTYTVSKKATRMATPKTM